MSGDKILWGAPVADHLRKKIGQDIKDIKEYGIYPQIAILRAGKAAGAIAYEKSIHKTFQSLGIGVTSTTFKEDVHEEDFLKELTHLNESQEIDGILVIDPLPPQLSAEKIAHGIDPDKDVEGTHPVNLGKLFTSSSYSFVPSVAKAVMALIDYYQIEINGLDICLIGRSKNVGKPLGMMLLNQGGSLTICHSETNDLIRHTQRADLVVLAAGQPHLLKEKMIRPGAIVIDIGYHQKNGEIVGDADTEGLLSKVKAITPVPGGIGAITSMALAEQVLLACKKSNKKI